MLKYKIPQIVTLTPQLFQKRMLVLQMKLCIQIDMFHFVG